VWPGWNNTPAFLRQYENNPTELRNQINAHIVDQAGALKGKLTEWDVVNEPYQNNAITNVLGGNLSLKDWFVTTANTDPQAVRYINEVSTLPFGRGYIRDFYYNLISQLKNAGTPIQGIGEQGHFEATTLNPPVEMLRILDSYATLNLPIQVTEFDLAIDRNDPAQVGVQVDFTRYFLTAMFSHPSVVGVMSWGF
jgi:GH35 family endo-1,4-beta-xylanase